MAQYTDKIIRKGRPLYHIFSTVPRHYDLINRIVTWRLDKRWRREAARGCLASHPEKVLDICCGTGDLAITLAQLAEDDVELTAIDYSQPMLEIAATKAERLGFGQRISFIHGDVADLPFPDEYFDCVGISFALRNLTHKNPLVQRYLAEILRVLKTGGRFVIVETSQPKLKLVRTIYHLYLRWFVFRLGYLISRNRRAYHYMAESAARFYYPEELKELLLVTGFSQIFFRPLFLGAVGVHVAVK